jgi:hypothetical protein
VEFNASGYNMAISSGVYYYKITATDIKTGTNLNLSKKMVLLK